MEEIVRFLQNVFPRLDGPLHFRLILQPTIAMVLAIRDGLKDAREGQPYYFRALFTRPDIRKELLRSGWESISNVFFLALVLDFIYQIIVLRWFYPFEALLVATALAVLPYIVIRGITNRLNKRLGKLRSGSSEHEKSRAH
ncbi:MAG TPA: hypothetical protein VLE19_11245 [Pyrinomonadaceae bacterium]|nr:hypothetical protein [Pyrinomonadaceae bacterium]